MTASRFSAPGIALRNNSVREAALVVVGASLLRYLWIIRVFLA
jgi:hypothetical protein